MNIFVPIEKYDAEQRMVWGHASTPSLDSQGERVTVKAIQDALPEYMKFANIREIHRNSAVGKTKSAEIDEDGLYIGAKIVDDVAWAKVKEGVYGGFSIGGRVTQKVDNEIQGLELVEISLVDRPANPDSVFSMWKADIETEQKPEEKPEGGAKDEEQAASETKPVEGDAPASSPAPSEAEQPSETEKAESMTEDQYLARVARHGMDQSRGAYGHRLSGYPDTK